MYEHACCVYLSYAYICMNMTVPEVRRTALSATLRVSCYMYVMPCTLYGTLTVAASLCVAKAIALFSDESFPPSLVVTPTHHPFSAASFLDERSSDGGLSEGGAGGERCSSTGRYLVLDRSGKVEAVLPCQVLTVRWYRIACT